MVLGIPGFVAAILLIIFIFLRHLWRDEAEQEEEAIRLFNSAKQEAVVAEFHSGANFGSSTLPVKPYCVVCLSPTTTRCSQCKTVRYCSRKCQIIHWRQGHKYECQLSILFHSGEEIKSTVPIASNADFDIPADSEIKGHADSKDNQEDFASLSTLLSEFCISKTGSPEASVGKVLGSQTNERFQAPSDSGNPCIVESGSKTVDSLTSLPVSGPSTLSCPRLSNAKKLKKKKSPRVDIESTIYIHNKNGGVGTEFEEFPVSDSEAWNSSCSSVSQRCSWDWNNNEAVFSEDEDKRSFPFSDLNHPILSNTGRHPVGSFNDANTKCTHTVSELGNVHRSPQLPDKGLNIASRVIKPFRKSDDSNPSYTGNRKDAPGEHKETFLYKLFMQLYSFEGLACHPFGLINCGKSCYANAVLQCLAFARPLTSYLVQGLHSRTCLKKDWCFLCEFESLILKGREGISPLNPIRILSEIQKVGNLSPGREEDAHEFLRFTIDMMQSICLEEAGVTDKLAEQSTLIDLTFGGYLQSKIKCMKCLGRSERYDRIMDLTVEIDGGIETLDEALAQFTAYETLDGENKYRCSRCKSYEKAIKRLTVQEAPNVLTIVLKRFQSGNLEKLNKFIQFTECLNLAPYMSRSRGKDLKYHLYAVIVHLDMMNGADFGHYICYVKNSLGEWFRVDDTMVMATELERVLFEKAYILLYSRDTPRLPSLLRNIGKSADAKCTRKLEAVSSGTSRSVIPEEVSIMAQSVESLNDTKHCHLLQSQPWQYSIQGNPFINPSDSSSYFTSSDAATSSTDGTKDSHASPISGYIFGSSLHNPSGSFAY